MMAPPMRARTIRVDGLRVRVLESAPPAERDDPVLLIHGLAGWAENWDPVVPALVGSGRRVVAVDLPGFGESERARRPPYFDLDAPFYGRFVGALLDTLGVRRAHVAGHSFGGAVAYTFAIWAPERVRSLTLVAPGGIGTAVPPGFRFLTLPFMEIVARWRATPPITRLVLHSCFHDPRACPEEVLAQAIRYGPPSVPEMVSVLRAGVTLRGEIRADVRRAWLDRRHRYTGPILVVWGREDRVLPVILVEQVRELAPSAEVHVIPRCGHLVMIERPRELEAVLVPFLERAAA